MTEPEVSQSTGGKFRAILHRLLLHWRGANEWIKAFVLAVLLLVALHVFVVRFVIVESTSMFATLRPGDLVMVYRWPVWTGCSRNDVVVFRDPLRDSEPMLRRPLLVKRIVGLPGDVVELRSGKLYVNNEQAWSPPNATRAYLVRLRKPLFADSLVRFLGLDNQLIQPGRAFVELPMNEAMARKVVQLPYVLSADPMGPSTGAPRHIFPFSQRYQWNGDDMGPLRIPAIGDSLRITVEDLPLYDRLISVYEGHRLSVDHNVLLMDGEPLTTYVVEQDYYYVLGDSRHHSADSRYWGFLPTDHLAGRAGPVLWRNGDSPWSQ